MVVLLARHFDYYSGILSNNRIEANPLREFLHLRAPGARRVRKRLHQDLQRPSGPPGDSFSSKTVKQASLPVIDAQAAWLAST